MDWRIPTLNITIHDCSSLLKKSTTLIKKSTNIKKKLLELHPNTSPILAILSSAVDTVRTSKRKE